MRNKTSFWERSLAALLSFVMVLSMFPVLGENPAIEAEAAPVDAAGDPVGDYITLPITIRDFAADGMLFEYNEVDTSDTCSTTNNSTIAVYKNYEYYTEKYDYPHVWQYSFKTIMDAGLNEWWQVVFVNSDGSVNRVCRGDEITDTAIPENGMVIFAHNSAINYPFLNKITNNNKGYYSFGSSIVTDTTVATGYYLGVTWQEPVYQQADTKGFGLLLTGDNDRIQNLTKEDGPGKYFGNGDYNSSTAPDPIDITLNSGAEQQGHGIIIRTDLVAAELDKTTGKPAYTEDTVTYLAEYMNQIMNEPWPNADGSYNTFFVMGTKMFDEKEVYVGPGDPNAVYDLAEILRRHVTGEDELGDYTTTMNKLKADANALSDATKCQTWFDAAYYLLHYTWRDNSTEDNGNDGYGKPVSEYHSLHLVEKTKSDGSVYYVFNSGYDNTVYDPANGEIYNTQTDEITAAQYNGSDFYTRGNLLPAARFDPLGYSGTAQWLGYGDKAGGNTYGDLTGASATQTWDEYYDTTNYHLSLEGHAKFVYHQDANQYFTFTGDDDVYLYINGIRVLDVGGAHSIAKVSIDLNDAAEKCGLKDGGAYSFDFFYLERHGTAANFGIETNIQIAEPSLTTTKTGYQGGSSTGYNGFVDPETPVAYSFNVKNDGEAAIENLIFDDPTINIHFSKDEVTLYPEGEENHCYSIDDMYLYIFNPDGSVKESYSPGKLTEQIIKNKMAAGLDAGESIGIYGFKYQITDDDWGEDNTFTNTVTTTGTSATTGKELRAVADWKVQKSTEPLNKFHVYDWLAQNISKNPEVNNTWYHPTGYTGVTVTVGEILDILVENNVISEEDCSSASIVQCTASGNEDKYNLHPNVTEELDGTTLVSLTYKSTIPGVDRVYFKVKGINKDSLVFNYRVFTFGAVDNIYVLDYGLAVELNDESFGLLTNDHLNVVGADVKVDVTDIDVVTNKYGDFTLNGSSLKYTPDDIIDNTDSVRVNVRVLETGATEVNKFTGVNMFETVTTAPASVVYYEENFRGITYVNGKDGDGNQWGHYETVDKDNNSVAGTEQSADQNMNYGSDPNYADDKIGWDEETAKSITFTSDTSDPNVYHQTAVDALNEYLGLSDEDSNGTVNKLEVEETAEVMWFDFVGTGFEILSRTTKEQYAVLSVEVYLTDENGDVVINQKGTNGYNSALPSTNKDGIVRVKPVVTESMGGTVYQVPVISITGMQKANYHVSVTAAAHNDHDRILYIDGIRIYGPLSDDEAIDYYNPEEYETVFYEIKELIGNYKAIFASLYETEGIPELGTGSTLIEETADEGFVLTNLNKDGDAVTLEDYLSYGPNNEIYMDGNTGNMIAFFLIPDEDVPVAERTIQIGAHRKADAFGGYDDAVGMYYGSTVDALTVADITEQPYYHTVASGTEQYFDIDVNNLELGADGRYLVMIAAGVSHGEGETESLALTSLKLKGYSVVFNDEELSAQDQNGTLANNRLVSSPVQVLKALKATSEPEAEEALVNENLEITSAALRAKTLASGKTAILSVKATSEADTIVVTDAQGDAVEYTRCTPKATSTGVTFTFLWKVTGSRGDVQNYTIRVYDAKGLASVNTKTVTITIR